MKQLVAFASVVVLVTVVDGQGAIPFGSGEVLTSVFQIPIMTLTAVHDLLQSTRVRVNQVQQYNWAQAQQYSQPRPLAQQYSQSRPLADVQNTFTNALLSFGGYNGGHKHKLQQFHRFPLKKHGGSFFNSKAIVQPKKAKQ